MSRKKTIWEMGRATVEEFRCGSKIPLVVVVDNVRSLNNIGSIFRSADGFAVERVVLCGISACPPSPEIHKTALGAENSVAWSYSPSALEAVEALKADGFTVAALELVHDSVALDRYPVVPGAKYAIVVGNEVDGVDQAVVDACNLALEIPQSGTKHSLNVAVSAAVAMWTFYSKLRTDE